MEYVPSANQTAGQPDGVVELLLVHGANLVK